MTVSKKIPIQKPFIHPVNNQPVYDISQEKMNELGITLGEDIQKYKDKLDKITLAKIIGILFDNVTCKSPSLFLLYGNVINWINQAKTKNEDYIQMTKSECEQFKSIFESTIIVKPELNAYVFFLIKSFEIFIENFDTLHDTLQDEKVPKIEN